MTGDRRRKPERNIALLRDAQDGMSFKDMATKYGVTPPAVREVMIRHGYCHRFGPGTDVRTWCERRWRRVSAKKYFGRFPGAGL